jgi:hypothetical protein
LVGMAEKPSLEQKGTPKIKLKGQTVWQAWHLPQCQLMLCLSGSSLDLQKLTMKRCLGWCHHWLWRAAKVRPMLGTQGLWAGRDLYHATPAVLTGPRFFLSRSSKGPPHSVASYDMQLAAFRGCKYWFN